MEPESFGTAGAQLDGFGYSFAEYYPYFVTGDRVDRPNNDIDGNSYPGRTQLYKLRHVE